MSYPRTRHREPAATLPLGYDTDVPIEHDPLNPHPEIPTPEELVVRLTQSQRFQRVERLTEMAHTRFQEALDAHGIGQPVRTKAGRDLGAKRAVAICSLVSGGNDSYTVEHLFRGVTTHHVHANTGTGIEATREFVRQTARDLGKPLIEVHPKPGEGYADLVLGQVWGISKETGEPHRVWGGGFPGPAAHGIQYQRLKERGLSQIPHHFGISNSRTERVVFIAGRRRAESKRRATVPHHEERGTVIWSSPIAVWHKADLVAYRLMHPDVAKNPVAKVLGMSGECGCLANAVAGEPDRWRQAYPDDPFMRLVADLEAELQKPEYDHIPAHRKKWGWGGTVDDPDALEALAAFDTTSLCGTHCGTDPLFDLMDPLFELDGAA